MRRVEKLLSLYRLCTFNERTIRDIYTYIIYIFLHRISETLIQGVIYDTFDMSQTSQ